MICWCQSLKEEEVVVVVVWRGRLNKWRLYRRTGIRGGVIV